jgi:hypothetical protein
MMTAPIGHNNPPCPFAPHEAHIGDLIELAESALHGNAIETQEQADAVEELLEGIKDAAKALEATRKAENKPFDDGKAAVQARAKPLANKLDIAKDTANKALTPFRVAEQEKKDAEQKRLREEAERLANEARSMFVQSAPTDLSARLEAEELAKVAKKATAAANKIERSATGLRTYWTATVTDYGALLVYMKQSDPQGLRDMLNEYAQKQKNAGARNLPGVEITEHRRAV